MSAGLEEHERLWMREREMEGEREKDTAFTSGGNCFAATSPSVVNTAS